MKDITVLKKNPDMVSRAIEGDTILVPIYKTSDEINSIYTLNDVAARIWGLIDGRRSIARIKALLSDEFIATSDELDRELGDFLKELLQIKAVVRR